MQFIVVNYLTNAYVTNLRDLMTNTRSLISCDPIKHFLTIMIIDSKYSLIFYYIKNDRYNKIVLLNFDRFTNNFILYLYLKMVL